MAELVREIVIDATPETIWPFLTDTEQHLEWIGTVGRDRRAARRRVPACSVGGEHHPPASSSRSCRCEKVVFTFGWDEKDHPIPAGSTTVEISLHPEGEKTLVRLVHRGLPADAVDDHGNGWAHYLERLSIVAPGGDPGPDVPTSTASRSARRHPQRSNRRTVRGARMKTPPIVSAEEWNAAREALLVKEKAA